MHKLHEGYSRPTDQIAGQIVSRSEMISNDRVKYKKGVDLIPRAKTLALSSLMAKGSGTCIELTLLWAKGDAALSARD